MPSVVGAVVAGIVVVLTGLGGSPTAAGTPAVPEVMAGYSHLTGSVSSSPPGPAVALWQHGYGVEFLDFPQAVVLGAGGDTYRRVDVAEERAGSETQGDPAPMLLSPDGTRVAVGDHDVERPDVVVVDLTTGETTRHALPAGRSVVPVAWSSDGETLASLVSDEATNPYSGGRITGEIALLDLPDDSAEVVDLDGSATAAAFSPDGSELAVEQSGGITVVDLQDGSRRSLEVDGVLAGPAAWSPDGRLLAVTTVEPTSAPPGVDAPGIPSGLSFVDADGRGRAVPDPLPLDLTGPGRVLGWAGPAEVLTVLAVTGDRRGPTSRRCRACRSTAPSRARSCGCPTSGPTASVASSSPRRSPAPSRSSIPTAWTVVRGRGRSAACSRSRRACWRGSWPASRFAAGAP